MNGTAADGNMPDIFTGNGFYGTDNQDEGYIKEHALEVSTRIKNLFWTISGDYSVDIDPDVEEYARSRKTAVYDAVKQGALVRYFDPDALSRYVLRRSLQGADEKLLSDLMRLAVECACFPLLSGERKGIRDLRADAFREALGREEGSPTVFSEALKYIMTEWLRGKELSSSMPGMAGRAAVFGTIRDTESLIREADRLYTEVSGDALSDGGKAPGSSGYIDVREVFTAAEREALSDEEMERIIKKMLGGMKKSMLRLGAAEGSRPVYRMVSSAGSGPVSSEEEEKKTAEKLDRLVSLHYGRSYLKKRELRSIDALLCRGIHRRCSLYFTEGILHSPVTKNYIYRFDQLQFEKNRMYYYANHRVIKKNVAVLTDMLRRILVLKRDDSSVRSRSGSLVPSRLWKISRTTDELVFDRITRADDSDFVVDILLDGSGSQLRRQPQVAAQGYIISRALSAAGIPHRVMSFCTFWKYTVLQRFRDYDDGEERDARIFEYRASSGNRDGLALKAVTDGLLKRKEEHKILIVLSDGRPEDGGREGNGRFDPYQGEEALKDTAKEVRKARASGISVLGIFAGLAEDLQAEKKIYGKDFAYIRDIAQFSQTVGTYLRKQIDEA